MIGIGVDLVDVHRFRTVLQRRAQISERLFTKNELSYCNLATDPTERLATICSEGSSNEAQSGSRKHSL